MGSRQRDGIEHHVGAETTGQLGTRLPDLKGDDPSGSRRPQQRDRAQTDRPGPEHDGKGARAETAGFIEDRVVGDAGRLYHRARLEGFVFVAVPREQIVDLPDVASLARRVLRHATVDGEPNLLDSPALVHQAGPAGFALPAPLHLFGGDEIAHPKPGDRRSELFDDSGKLMPEHYGSGDRRRVDDVPLSPSLVAVHVRSAVSAGFHLDEDLIGLGLWDGKIRNAEARVPPHLTAVPDLVSRFLAFSQPVSLTRSVLGFE